MNNPYQPPRSNLSGANSNGGDSITPEVFNIMRGTRPWPMIVGITTLINSVVSIFNVLNVSGDLNPGAMVGFFISTALNVYLAIKLLGYSSRIGRLMASGQDSDLQEALTEHRKYWKTMGILALIVVILFAVGLLFGIAAASGRR